MTARWVGAEPQAYCVDTQNRSIPAVVRGVDLAPAIAAIRTFLRYPPDGPVVHPEGGRFGLSFGRYKLETAGAIGPRRGFPIGGNADRGQKLPFMGGHHLNN